MKYIFFVSVFFVFLSCNPEKRFTDKPNWKSIFENEGIQNACFEIMDNGHEWIYDYNIERSSQRKTPASTFKIFNSLVALETAAATDINMTIAWDGVKRRESWNKDMDMKEAFKVSSVPYYQELARRIGRTEMQKYLDSVKYGNMKIGKEIDEFWLDESLQISADEQVGFIKKMYFDELPFSKRTQRLVRSIMLREDSSQSTSQPYRLYYKTGTALSDSSDVMLAWLVGYLEVIEKNDKQNSKPYFFATNMDFPKSTNIDTMAATRLKIMKEVFKEMKLIGN